MRKKMLIVTFLSLVLTLGLFVSLSAAEATDLTNESDVYSVEFQHERLMELLRGEVVVPFGFEGESVNVPRVNFILPPEGYRTYFLIGIEDEPTPECINFILMYTGIPEEFAVIDKAVLSRRILLDCETCECDEVIITPEEYTGYFQGIMPLSTWGMGQMISVPGLGNVTMGHPLNSGGLSFATSLHASNQVARHRYVYIRNTNTRIGTVTNSFFDSRRDVAFVSLHSPHRINPTVQGGAINNFQQRAALNDTVVSIRGVSGTQQATVVSINASGRFFGDPFDFTNKIATGPVGRIEDGDSGAALIRRMSPTDRAVLGTLTGDAIVGGRHVVIYTCAMAY